MPTRIWAGLVSEFFDRSYMERASVYAKTYLILNNTLNSFVFGMPSMNITIDTSGTPELGQHSREGEWLDMSFWDDNVIISASLCYATFDFADIGFRISSQSNRTESRLEPVFDRDTSTYTFAGLRNAMGQDRSLPIDKRGVLALEKSEWQHTVPQENYTEYIALTWLLRSTVDLGFTQAQDVMNATVTSISAFFGTWDQVSFCPDCIETEHMHVSTLATHV
jgi:hypothetical protein